MYDHHVLMTLSLKSLKVDYDDEDDDDLNNDYDREELLLQIYSYIYT